MAHGQWRYSPTVIIGMLAGGVSFILLETASPSSFDDQLGRLGYSVGIGIVLSAGAVLVRNRWLRRAMRLADERRRIWLPARSAPEPMHHRPDVISRDAGTRPSDSDCR